MPSIARPRSLIRTVSTLLAAAVVIVAVALLLWRASGRPFPWSQAAPSYPLPAELPLIGRIALIADGTLWVIDPREGRKYEVAAVGPGARPRWSSDGEWLSYEQPDGLWVVHRDGREALLLAPGVASVDATWSPRHAVLAYPAPDGGLLLNDVTRGDDGKVQILPPVARVVAPVIWDPEGRQYAWVQSDRGNRLGTEALWTANFPRGEPRLLYSYSGPELIRLGGWSGDGQHIWFWRGDLSAQQPSPQSLFTLSVDGGRALRVAARAPVQTGAVVAAPSSSAVALLGGQVTPDAPVEPLQVLAIDDSAAQVSVPVSGSVASVAWAPDGSSLAFTSTEDGSGSRSQASVAVLPDMAIEALTGQSGPERAAEVWPQWSRTGEYVLMVRLAPGSSGRAELWVMKTDGTDARQVSASLDRPGETLGTAPLVDFGSLVAWHRR
ncbi:MAG: hypothetical protein CL878_00635 [Dehalococcoidia bacterium]|nr:hypothetical protein [Dehalococcoidia bacterium]